MSNKSINVIGLYLFLFEKCQITQLMLKVCIKPFLKTRGKFESLAILPQTITGVLKK